MYISKRSGMDHTVLPANTPCLPIFRKRSPDGATPNWGKRHPIAAYCSSIDLGGMKGWVGLVGWRWGMPIFADWCQKSVTIATSLERSLKEGRIDYTHTNVWAWKFDEDRSSMFSDNWSPSGLLKKKETSLRLIASPWANVPAFRHDRGRPGGLINGIGN